MVLSVRQLIKNLGGTEHSAKIFGVHRRVVSRWTQGVQAPRLKSILKMIKLSEYNLTIWQIAAETTRKLPRGRKLTKSSC